ncbi:MAG TPA: oxygenase MpaB family protein [Polyangiales bacterium]
MLQTLKLPFRAIAKPNPPEVPAEIARDLAYRTPFGRPRPKEPGRLIAELDAERDCERIVRLLLLYEFPFDLQRALEIALVHTYGSRSVARLLDKTGEFEKRGQKRYDDTRTLIAYFLVGGFRLSDGQRAIEQMNRIHARYTIPNDDYLFVLWTFIDFPIQWMREFGWRAFTAHEAHAWFTFWCEVGRRMGLKDIPPTKPAFDMFVHAYEAREFVPNEASRRVTEATIRIIEAWVPAALRPLVGPVLLSLVRPHMLPAAQLSAPPAWVGQVARGVLKTRARIKRYVSLENVPVRVEDTKNRTYPNYDFTIETLGPAYAHQR